MEVFTSLHVSRRRKYPAPFPFSLYDVREQSLPLYNLLKRHVKQKSCLLKPHLPFLDLSVPANEKLLAWVGDEILPQDSAKLSKAVIQFGRDLRVYSGKIFKLDEHLDRLFDSAKALAFENVLTRVKRLKKPFFGTLIRNGMSDNCSHPTISNTGQKGYFWNEPSFLSLWMQLNWSKQMHSLLLETMGELSPVVKIDSRIIGDGKVEPVTRRLQNAYKNPTGGDPIPRYHQT